MTAPMNQRWTIAAMLACFSTSGWAFAWVQLKMLIKRAQMRQSRREVMNASSC